jgi:hypothetical protein
MAPRIALAALSIAFGIADVGAAVTSVRQLNLQSWAFRRRPITRRNRGKSSELRT